MGKSKADGHAPPGPLGCLAGARLRMCCTPLARMRGMIGREAEFAEGAVLLIAPCASVHTFLMRCSIDVALIGPSGFVLAAWRGLGPGRVVAARGACAALERVASRDPWFRVGERALAVAPPKGMGRQVPSHPSGRGGWKKGAKG